VAEKITLKVVLIGDEAVGKTSIRRTFMGENFKTQHLTTLGADFAIKTINVDVNQKKISAKVQIWDIAGQDSFKRIRSNFLKNTKGVLLVFDITREETFQNLLNWLMEVWKVNKTVDIPVLVIGNKIDLDSLRVVDGKMINKFLDEIKQRFVKMSDPLYIETSAKTGENIEQGFEMISSEIYKKMKENTRT